MNRPAAARHGWCMAFMALFKGKPCARLRYARCCASLSWSTKHMFGAGCTQ